MPTSSLGATFDESLEGIVRVSVVATGIDNTGAAHQMQPAESALTELAGKLRNESHRIADRIEPSATQPHISSVRRRVRWPAYSGDRRS